MTDEGVKVMRCEACGDVFPIDGHTTDARCPSCGSGDLHEAHEPLL